MSEPLPELEADFLALMDSLGKTTIAFFPCGERLEVECWGMNRGVRRIPPEAYSISGYNDEHARFAKAYFIASKAALPDGSVHRPPRGEVVELFGSRWQIREASEIGFTTGVVTALTLVNVTMQGSRQKNG